jgi:hypothetical protein
LTTPSIENSSRLLLTSDFSLKEFFVFSFHE